MIMINRLWNQIEKVSLTFNLSSNRHKMHELVTANRLKQVIVGTACSMSERWPFAKKRLECGKYHLDGVRDTRSPCVHQTCAVHSNTNQAFDFVRLTH